MRRESCRVELLRLLAEMPFLDRQDMAAVSGRSTGSVYENVRILENWGLVSSFSHGSETTANTERYCLTAAGLRELSDRWCMTPDRLVREYPVSAQWVRLLLERLDSVAVIYRLASTISAFVRPIRFTWYRAMPMDAAISPPGRTDHHRRKAGSHLCPGRASTRGCGSSVTGSSPARSWLSFRTRYVFATPVGGFRDRPHLRSSLWSVMRRMPPRTMRSGVQPPSVRPPTWSRCCPVSDPAAHFRSSRRQGGLRFRSTSSRGTCSWKYRNGRCRLC